MTYIEPFTDRINQIGAILVALLSYIFGDFWILFAAFMLANVIDCVTGCMKSRLKGVISSTHGLNGIIKKFGYWIMVVLAFGMSAVFIEIGEVIHVNLEITEALGWLVLASLFVNEVRSILENLVECDYKVPAILVKSLEVVNKTINKVTDEDL